MVYDPQQDARERASQHRQRAGELYAEHRREGDPEILARANEENRQAEAWERRSRETGTGERTGNDAGKRRREQHPARGEAEEAEQPGWTDRRSWYLPGSVARDPLLQAEEARQGGLLDELGKYAARSALDREHRTFDGAKLAGKAVSAPIRAAADTARAMGRGAARAGNALSAPVQGAVRGGRAILDAARQHRNGGAHGQGEVARQGADRSRQRGERSVTRDRQPDRHRKTRSRNDREPER